MPAKDFNVQEREKVKFAKCDVFWVQVANIVRKGCTHGREINLFYEINGIVQLLRFEGYG